VDDSNEKFVMWKSWMLLKMEPIRPQMKYMMNVLGKRSVEDYDVDET